MWHTEVKTSYFMHGNHASGHSFFCTSVNREDSQHDWKVSMILNSSWDCEVLREIMQSNRPQECKSSTKPKVELAGGLSYSSDVHTLFRSSPFNIWVGPLLLLIKYNTVIQCSCIQVNHTVKKHIFCRLRVTIVI